VWRGARAVLALGLAALLLFGVGRGHEPGEPVLVDASTTTDELAAVLVADTAAGLTYAHSAPPTRAVAALLASAAEGGAEVTLAVPADAGRLRVVPPDRPVAGRRSALGVRVRGEPGSAVTMTVTGPTGAADTLAVSVGPDGRGAASVAVEPSRAGAAAWTVRTPDAEATVHAWVRPESPVRVLVWSGVPGWESRWLVRALESAGTEVAVRQDLGRGLAVTTEGAGALRTLDDLAAYDVLALVGAAADSAGALARRWVEERGGGLLLVGGGAAGTADGLRPWFPRGEPREVPAHEIIWAGPAEIVPLPSAAIVVRGVTLGGSGMPVALVGGTTTPTATNVAAGADSAAGLARAAHLGRGRIFASGLDTWPWAMEAGFGAEHEAYWESVVEWLAGGLRDDVLLQGEPAQPWVGWEGRLEGAVPETVVLRRPAGTDASAAAADERPPASEIVPAVAAGPTSATLSFVPTAEGGHALAIDGVPPRTADSGGATGSFGVVAAPPAQRLTWTAAALVLGGAGARIVPAGDPALLADARPARRSRSLPWIAFLALALLATTAWTARRVGGRP
jgi:hypothetical protein